jgi:hypothetical protein
MQELDIVERLAPSETKKEIVHTVRAGYVGAPPTPVVIAPTVERERERERELLWMKNLIDQTLSGCRSG